MKKNSKGFMLVETLVVSSFVIITLIFIYAQFQSINKSYERSFKYNTVNDLYAAESIRQYLYSDGYSVAIRALPYKASGYIVLYDGSGEGCASNIFSATDYCQKLMKELNVKTILYTKENLNALNNQLTEWRNKRQLPTVFSNKMVDFIKTIKYDGEVKNHRIIVEFNTDTYTSIKVTPPIEKPKPIVYSDWVTLDELISAGHSKDEVGILTKQQYKKSDITISNTAGGAISYTCTDRASCSKGTCVNGTAFDLRLITKFTASCRFTNTNATSSSSNTCTLQGLDETSAWVNLKSVSGTRNPGSTHTLSLAGDNTVYPDKKFKQLRLCWSMSDQNELYFSGSATQWKDYSAISNWLECDTAGCPTTNDSLLVTETRTLYQYIIK